MTPWYILKIGDFYLAPRPSITVVESDDFMSVTTNDQECGCSLVQEREFRFKLYINGRGSLATAYKIKERIDAALSGACSGGAASGSLLTRTLNDYSLSYTIRSGSTREIEAQLQMGCDAILVLELVVKLINTPAQISPLIVNVTIPTPSVSLVFGPSPAPVAIAVTMPQVGHSIDMTVSPLVVTVTKVTPTVTIV